MPGTLTLVSPILCTTFVKALAEVPTMTITPLLYCIIAFSATCLCIGAFKLPLRRFFVASALSFGIFASLVFVSFGSLQAVISSPFTARFIEIIVLILLCIFDSQPAHGAFLTSGETNKLTSNKYIALFTLFAIFQATSLTDIPAQDSIAALNHPLAMSHIVCAMSAKAAGLWAACKMLCQLEAPENDEAAFTWQSVIQRGMISLSCHQALSFALILQTLTVFLGMAWALEASNWNALWQWDPIETLSLITLGSMMAATAKPRLVWGLTLLFAIIATEILSTGVMTSGSRHSYAMPSYIQLGFNISIIVMSLLQTFLLRKREDFPTLPGTASFILILVTCVVCAGRHLQSTVLASFFIILFTTATFLLYKNKRYAVISAFCALTIATLPLTSSKTAIEFDATPLAHETPLGSAMLTSVRTTDHARSFTLKLGEHDYQFETESELVPKQNQTVVEFPQIWRLSATRYTPTQGLRLHANEITRSYLWLAIVALFICGMTTLSLTKHRRRKARQVVRSDSRSK